jgi:membrane-bound serine protease (ClpP class)
MNAVIRRLVFAAAALLGAAGFAAAAGADRAAVVIPIDGTVDEGMAHMVQRAVADANESGASAIVLDVNTPGGLVSSAFEIRDAIIGARVPTLAFISQRAYSAGALIALSAQHIEMAPGSSIGAAEPIPKSVKTVAALRAEFASTAARNHRDTTLASAMVDATVDAPSYKKSGAILALTADEAKRARITDGIAANLPEALHNAGIAENGTRMAAYTFAERVARFATSPEVSGLLLSLGMLGLLIEMQTLHGIAGLIGISSLGLFFGTHVYSGFSNSFVIALALAGVIGILFELHVVPGHGFAGFLGTAALVAAVVLSFGYAFLFVAAQSISIAIVLTAVAFWLTTRILPENAFLRRLTFAAAQGPEYVASEDHRHLLGATGVASSYLRPAGVASFGERRVDVLTEGDFVPAGEPIEVSRVEGARIFVRPISQKAINR